MGKTILIVEDDAEIRSIEKEILEDKGYCILEAATAKDGVALALKHPVDLIILDIRLPSKKRGIGAAKTLRKNDKTKDVPIIFVTAYYEGENAKDVANISNHIYVTKPFKIERLLEVINEKLK